MINKPAQTRRWRRSWLVAVLAGGVGVGWYLTRPESSPLQFETAVVSRGDLSQVVTATGQLNPVLKVEVGSQISGIIEKLFVDFNSTVKAGQGIAQITSR